MSSERYLGPFPDTVLQHRISPFHWHSFYTRMNRQRYFKSPLLSLCTPC